MSFIKVNSYTRLLASSSKTIEDQKALIDNNSLAKSDTFVQETKKATAKRSTEDYKKFCRNQFDDRKFIPQAEFNQNITKHFNGNASFYRKRMEKLQLITVKNRVVYPVN